MILVTGASGFVGSAVMRRLEACGASSVRVALREGSPSPTHSSDIVRIPRLALDNDWRAALVGVHSIVHLAARVHVLNDSASDPLAEYRRANVDGTLNLARQAACAGVRRLVFLSSVKVNGESTQPGRPFSASDSPNPRDPYAVSKLEAERGLQAIARQTGLEIVIIRPPLVYGPGVKANFRLLMQCLHRRLPLPLASLTNMRSLVALDNLADLIMVCLTQPAAANQTLLVSDGEDLSTPDLLRRLGLALNRPARLLPLPRRLLFVAGSVCGKGAMVRRLCESLQLDVSRTREMLDWSPPVSVDDGLRRTAEAFLREARI